MSGDTGNLENDGRSSVFADPSLVPLCTPKILKLESLIDDMPYLTCAWDDEGNLVIVEDKETK